MPSLQDIHNRQSRYSDSLVHAFESHLKDIVTRAQAKVLSELQKKLKITDGVIVQTPVNYRVLRQLNQMFLDAMDEAGYQRLVTAFVGEFPGQLPYLNEILELLSDEVSGGLPIANLKQDAVLQTFQLSSADALNGVVENVAGSVMQRSMLSVGGLEFGKLAQTLAEKLEVSVPRAVTLADTAMSTFMRTATGRAFDLIEKSAPQQDLEYFYSGPDDAITREFCRHLVESEKSYTREEIANMDNGMLPNVWLTAGGWNCRHQWLLSTTAFESAAKEPAVAVRPAA